MGTQLPLPKRAQLLPHFRLMSVVAQMPLGTEVDLSAGDIVLDGASSPPERGTATPPLFSVHVYCGQTVACLSYC